MRNYCEENGRMENLLQRRNWNAEYKEDTAEIRTFKLLNNIAKMVALLITFFVRSLHFFANFQVGVFLDSEMMDLIIW